MEKNTFLFYSKLKNIKKKRTPAYERRAQNLTRGNMATKQYRNEIMTTLMLLIFARTNFRVFADFN